MAACCAAVRASASERLDTAPATRPLSYLHVNAAQGPLREWRQVRFVVCSKASSWSMRKTESFSGESKIRPPFEGAKNRARVCPSVV